MKTQAEANAEDAAKWRLLLEMMDSSECVQVVMRGNGSGNPDERMGGMFASDGDELVEHLVTSAHLENPEGLPFDLRMLVDTLDVAA